MKLLKNLVLLLAFSMSSEQVFAQSSINSLILDIQNEKIESDQIQHGQIIKIPTVEQIEEINRFYSGSGFGPGNGGNQFIFEANSILDEIINIVRVNQHEFPEFSDKELTQTIKETAILFVDELPNSSNRYAEALNWDESKIILIRLSSWNSATELNKRKLMLHELLGIMNIERENSVVSNRLDELIGTQYQVINTFNTELKWLYSKNNNQDNIYHIDLFDNKSGELTLPYGHTKISWQPLGSKIVLTPKEAVSYTSAPLRKHPSGDIRLVTQENELVNIEIKNVDFIYQVTSYWKSCYEYNSSSTLEIKNQKTCYLNKSTSHNLRGETKLSSVSVNFKKGDSLLLPTQVDNNTSAYRPNLIKLNSSKVEQIVTANPFEKQIQSVSMNHKKVVIYRDNENAIYKLYPFKDMYGAYRSIVSYEKGEQKRVFMAPLMIIENSDFPSFTEENTIGDYLPIYASINHTNESYEPYFFDADHIGGFSNIYETQTGPEREFQFWQWKIENGNIVATRFREQYQDQSNGFPYNSTRFISDNREETKACTPETCIASWERVYKLLKVDGNRHFLIRTLTIKDPENLDIVLAKYASFWVKDKY